MKLCIAVIFCFFFIGSITAQSEFYEAGESGSSMYLEYSNVRLQGYFKRKDHVASYNLGYGWGGRGEFGFGIGLIDKEIFGNVNVGYNLFSRVKDHGLKVVSNFIVSRDDSFWEKGITAFGSFGSNNVFIPSLSLLVNGNHPIGEIRLRANFGSWKLYTFLMPAVRLSRGNNAFSISVGIMNKKTKKELPIEL